MTQPLSRQLVAVVEQDRIWAPRAFAAVLAATAAAEGIRLIVTGSVSETRYSGWYLLLVAVGLFCGALIRADAGKLPTPSAATAAVMASEEDEATPTPPRRILSAVILFAAAAGFAVLLPWLGFAFSTLLFLFVYLRWVSRVGWIKSIAYAVITDAVLVAGFALLSVRMPHGVFGSPL